VGAYRLRVSPKAAASRPDLVFCPLIPPTAFQRLLGGIIAISGGHARHYLRLAYRPSLLRNSSGAAVYVAVATLEQPSHSRPLCASESGHNLTAISVRKMAALCHFESSAQLGFPPARLLVLVCYRLGEVIGLFWAVCVCCKLVAEVGFFAGCLPKQLTEAEVHVAPPIRVNMSGFFTMSTMISVGGSLTCCY
jgi:hypothetical protein